MADLTATIPVSVSVVTPAPTPGYKTSEAWLTLAAILIGSLTTSGVLVGAPPLALQIAGIAGSVLAALGYTYSRTQLKTAHLGAAAEPAASRTPQAGRARFDVLGILATLAGGFVVTVVMMHFLGCATLMTMTGAWATCAKTDLGQIVDGQSKSLSAYVADLLDGNGVALESALAALAGQVGLDAVECAVTAYEQTHTATSTSTAMLPRAIVVQPIGLARAQAWIAAQRSSRK